MVTNLHCEPGYLCDRICCERGESKNRIKQAQVGLFDARKGCQHFAANLPRGLLAALTCVLIERPRALALQGTEPAPAQIDTPRIRLLKLAAVAPTRRGESGCTSDRPCPVRRSSRRPCVPWARRSNPPSA